MNHYIVLTYVPPVTLWLLIAWISTTAINSSLILGLMVLFTAHNFIMLGFWQRKPYPAFRINWHQRFSAYMTLAGAISVIWGTAKAIGWLDW